MQINENGVISFEDPWQYSYPNRFPTNYYFTRKGLAVAPFWSDNDIRLAGAVRYATYSSNNDVTNTAGQMLLDEVNRYIQERQTGQFTGNWLLIAHWDKVHPSPHGDGNPSAFPMDELEKVLLHILLSRIY